MKKNLDFNRNPGGTNQHILRSDAELQKIIDDSGLPIIGAETLLEACNKAVSAVNNK